MAEPAVPRAEDTRQTRNLRRAASQLIVEPLHLWRISLPGQFCHPIPSIELSARCSGLP